MPIHPDPLSRGRSACLRGPLSTGEIESLAADARLKFLTVRGDEPQRTWEDLNEHLFSRRRDVTLDIDSFWPGHANLKLLRHTPEVRRLCVTGTWSKQKITSLDSISTLRSLEYLAIGSPALKTFDVLDCLPPHHLRELRLASTYPHKPSLRPVARFTRLKSLDLAGHAKDIEALRALQGIESLRLDHVRLKDSAVLTSFPALASLEIVLGSLNDAAALSYLVQLKHLELCGTRGLDSLSFLAGMRGLQWLELRNLSSVVDYPDLSPLKRLRRVCLHCLKRLESVEGLAKAPALEEYQHLAAWNRPADFFLCLLDHPTLRRFSAFTGSKKGDDALRDLAERKGKLPCDPSPFIFQ